MYLTYRDAIDHLIDVYSLDGKDVQTVIRRLRRAVKEACNKLPAMHDWEFLQKTGMFTTSPQYSTGTVAYTSATRFLTLTSGTWPTDAEFGDVIVDNKRFMVARRNSSTVLTLDEYQCPAENIAAGTSYKWVRQRYTLPYFVGDIREVTDIQLLSLIRRIQVDDNFWYSEAWNITGSPSAWSMTPSRRRPGQWDFWLSSVPNDVRQYRYLYQTRWASNEVEELTTGTVSIAADVATFSSGLLTSACVGAVLRVSSTSAAPTSAFGRYNSTTKVVDLNPPASEHIITQVNSTTEAILNIPVASSVTTKPFTISSYIDLNTEGMLEFFYRLCEYQYEIISRGDKKNVQFQNSLMLDALRSAMAADARNLESGRAKIIDPRPIIRE